MVSRHIRLTAREDAAIKRRARQAGVKEAELLRRGVDWVISSGAAEAARDPRAWERELRFIRRRAKAAGGGTGRSWTRSELYDERVHVPR